MPAAPRCKVALVVTDVPANAEILLRMGQAPLDVERMPVGTRLEFVATAEGYAPRRAVIKAESPWDKTPDGKPRIDVPIQLDPTKAKAGHGRSAGRSPSRAARSAARARPARSTSSRTCAAPRSGSSPASAPRHASSSSAATATSTSSSPDRPQLRKRLHVGEKEIQAATPDPQGNRVVSVSAK